MDSGQWFRQGGFIGGARGKRCPRDAAFPAANLHSTISNHQSAIPSFPFPFPILPHPGILSPMPKRWTEPELLIAMNLYCRLPFGQFDQRNAMVRSAAVRMGRTPSSVSMKLCNLASFDPALQARGVGGLKGASVADRAMWEAFAADWTSMAEKSEAAYEALMAGDAFPQALEAEPTVPAGPSEMDASVRVRRHQGFFRNVVLSSYEYRCALSGLEVPALLNASHIIPWKDSEPRRADPTNGLCLHALYDRAFDRGIITFDPDCRLLVSSQLKTKSASPASRAAFADREGQPLALPHRFRPDPEAMDYHRKQVFVE